MKLIHGDCLEKMKDIPDKSIDMILCDLPYGTTRLKWDSVIDLTLLWWHYKRIVKVNGAIVLFANQPFTSALISSNFEMFRYSWIWEKPFPTGFLNANYRPMLSFEDICVFSHSGAGAGSKDNAMVYYPQGLVPKNVKKKNKPNSRGAHIHDTVNCGSMNVLNSGKEYEQKFTGYPNNILSFDRDLDQSHQTQKPVPLLEYLIKTYTLEGETVLDNTMGSGSTGIACINTKRNFIGIEKDDKFFEIAKSRIETHETTCENKSVNNFFVDA